ncbi:Chromodomain Y-Like Protein [Manis pentadactyla]|nr:Chromodomain Y-Like Protein [Manis pentadactyla]
MSAIQLPLPPEPVTCTCCCLAHSVTGLETRGRGTSPFPMTGPSPLCTSAQALIGLSGKSCFMALAAQDTSPLLPPLLS